MKNVENLVSSKKDLAAINRKNFKLSMIDNDSCILVRPQ